MNVKGLNALAKEIVEINLANGWDVMTPQVMDDAFLNGVDAGRRVSTVLALIHSEVSEALEALRNGDRQNFEEEIADIIIRCLDLTGGAGIDIDNAVLLKLERNRNRGFRHGGKLL